VYYNRGERRKVSGSLHINLTSCIYKAIGEQCHKGDKQQKEQEEWEID
jgi:hypothetical protein